jgi:molybdate transport system substrate-binding protein
MAKWNRLLAVLLFLIMIIALAGCSESNSSNAKKKSVNLTISAAASLKDAMDELNVKYTKENPEVTFTINYGASGALEQQIEQGADADLFLSAAAKQMDQLTSKGMIIEDTNRNLLANQLVLVVPVDSKVNLKNFADVTSKDIKKLALGEPKSVPAGQYAEEAFTKLGILNSVKSKAVYGQNVREVLTWVGSGNADAGVVYASDAKVSSEVKVVATAAEDTHSPIVYPAAIIKSSKNSDAAKAFLDYLGSSEAKTVFQKYGFTVK